MRMFFTRIVCVVLTIACAGVCTGAGSRGTYGIPPAATAQCTAEYSVRLRSGPQPEFSGRDAELIAKTLYGECRGCAPVEQAAVAWCILNRADSGGQTVEQVVASPGQFMGYSEHNPVDEALYDLAADVLVRHAREQLGETAVGRVLPREYKWFSGDGRRNHFRDSYSSGNVWDWSLPDPYSEPG
ncbi:MAG: hypothetical protein ACOX81_01625 [Candidatus Heteroscillospira sp.]